jgi:hypothetical protein
MTGVQAREHLDQEYALLGRVLVDLGVISK